MWGSHRCRDLRCPGTAAKNRGCAAESACSIRVSCSWVRSLAESRRATHSSQLVVTCALRRIASSIAGGKMNELDAVHASLASFTTRLDEVSTDRFNELRKCSFFDPIPSELLRPISDQTEIRTFS